jgi:hypothetical protein
MSHNNFNQPGAAGGAVHTCTWCNQSSWSAETIPHGYSCPARQLEPKLLAQLTKREYFAGLAMQALTRSLGPESTAIRALQYADALLKELEKK